MLAHDKGWIPLFSKFRNQIYHLSLENNEFIQWNEWIQSLKADSLSWEVLHKNNMLIDLKYDLEKYAKQMSAQQSDASETMT